MKRKKFKLRPHGWNIPLSGGIRVEEYGLIKVLEDSTIIWGMHNYTYETKHVKKGYIFNSLDIVGNWHDVIPKFKRKDKQYFKKMGNSIPYEEVEKLNIEGEKSPKCQDCGQRKSDVLERHCPYSEDVNNTIVLVQICNNCNKNRTEDI